MMKIKRTFFWMVLITSSLYAQSHTMRINQKVGNQITVATEAIRKMTFALDQTPAAVVLQKDSSQIKATLTNITNITFRELTTVDEPESRSEINPRKFVLHQNYPNPFNPSTTIEYELPAPGWIKIQIFNLQGQVVRYLESGYFPARAHRVVWNGENDNRELVANGIYFYQVQFNDFVQTKKLVLVR